MLINKPSSSFYDLVSAELPFGSVLLALKTEFIHHAVLAHLPHHRGLFRDCFPLSPPTEALLNSAVTPENPSMPSGGFGPAEDVCTVQERLQRERKSCKRRKSCMGGQRPWG